MVKHLAWRSKADPHDEGDHCGLQQGLHPSHCCSPYGMLGEGMEGWETGAVPPAALQQPGLLLAGTAIALVWHVVYVLCRHIEFLPSVYIRAGITPTGRV